MGAAWPAALPRARVPASPVISRSAMPTLLPRGLPLLSREFHAQRSTPDPVRGPANADSIAVGDETGPRAAHARRVVSPGGRHVLDGRVSVVIPGVSRPSTPVRTGAFRRLTAARRPAYHPPALAERLAAADGKESIRMWNDLFIRRVTPPTGAGVRGRSVPISS